MYAPRGVTIDTTTIDASAGALVAYQPLGEVADSIKTPSFEDLEYRYDGIQDFLYNDIDDWDGRSPPRLFSQRDRQKRRDMKKEAIDIANAIAHYMMTTWLRDRWIRLCDGLHHELNELDEMIYWIQVDNPSGLLPEELVACTDPIRNKASALEAYLSTRMKSHKQNIKGIVGDILSDFVINTPISWADVKDRIEMELDDLMVVIYYEKDALLSTPLPGHVPLDVLKRICECL